MEAEAQWQHQQTACQHRPATSSEEVRILNFSGLPSWADESDVLSWFSNTNEVLVIKVTRKATGEPAGHGFLEFTSHAAAERFLQSYNGSQIPGTNLTFRLNWSSEISEKRVQLSIVVWDLASDVTDDLLQETFRARYPSVNAAKVVSGKGYGFVRFGDEMERNRAMAEMNGVYCSTRPMRISAVVPTKTFVPQQKYYAARRGAYPAQLHTQLHSGDININNSTIFVGNLDPDVTEDELRQSFLQVGEIVNVKIPTTKGCGFVQFATRTSAEEAIQRMNGAQIGQVMVRISWARPTVSSS